MSPLLIRRKRTSATSLFRTPTRVSWGTRPSIFGSEGIRPVVGYQLLISTSTALPRQLYMFVSDLVLLQHSCSLRFFPDFQINPCYYFGFVYFRQMKDASITRGYLQKSVVIITALPLFSLFHNMLHFIAPGYFTSGKATIEAGVLDVLRLQSVVIITALPLFSLFHNMLHFIAPGYFTSGKATIEAGVLDVLRLQSVVIITALPLFSLFHNMLHFIAPGYFTSGKATIEAACHNVDQWPKPEPGVALTLPLMGSVIHCRIPTLVDKTSPGHKRPSKHTAFPEPLLLPAPHELNLYDVLFSMIPYLQLFWELVLLNEPMVIMASNPRATSEFVQCLVSLVWPLQYGCDYRPFFTIHDSEFKEYATSSQAPPGVLLGVTNPFFGKTLRHWPHVVRMSDDPRPTESSLEGSPINGAKMKRSSDFVKTLDCKPGIYSKYTCCLQKDKAFLKRIFKGVQTKRPSEVQCAMIRKHFVELTQNFLIPLERYLAGIMPLHRNIGAFRCTPKLREFDAEEFLANMDEYGPQLTTGIKGDWIGLYRRFVETKNFEVWLAARRADINRKLEWLHLEAICKADFSEAILDRSEVELVDLLFRLQEKEKFLHQPENISRYPEFSSVLSRQKDVLVQALSEDLRQSVRTR